MVRRDDGPAARFGLKEQVDEVGIGDAEQGLYAFSLEQVENAFVHWGAALQFRCGLIVV